MFALFIRGSFSGYFLGDCSQVSHPFAEPVSFGIQWWLLFFLGIKFIYIILVYVVQELFEYGDIFRYLQILLNLY